MKAFLDYSVLDKPLKFVRQKKPVWLIMLRSKLDAGVIQPNDMPF